jgi:hypothetical protein
MLRLPAVVVALTAVFIAAGCGSEDSGEANLPKPMEEAEIQKLGPEQQESIRKFQEMQRQNSNGQVR